MKALVTHDFNEARVEDITRPVPDPDQVLIEVNRVQLSVTECNYYQGSSLSFSEVFRERLESGPARMLGHEFSGTIVEIGDDVSDFEAGDRVYAPSKVTCGACAYCNSNHEIYCTNSTRIGYQIPGALAEYFAAPTEPLCKLPNGVTDAEGAAMQPLASSVLYARKGDIDMENVVAVVGTGVMGNQVAQLSQISGAKEVFAIDIDTRKLSIAEDRGMTPIDATDEDPVEAIEEATDGVGADVAFEAVGGDQSHGTEGNDPLAQAMRMVRRGGSVIQVGHIIGDIAFTPRQFRSKGVNWVGPTGGVEHLSPNTDSGELAARLVERGEVSIDESITHELDGLENFEKAVEITMNKDDYDALGPAQMIV